jgi:FkbM family methyltransferase
MKILPNGIAVIDGDSHISRWVEEEGRLDHDQNALPLILEHIKEGDVVIDAGAFIGDHTIAYTKAVGTKGSVIAFEPNPAAFKCLLHNCPNANLFNYGLGSGTRSAFLQMSENAGASSLGESGEEVRLMCLDELNLDRLDFIKLDVEGYEVEALKGGINLINKFRPKMWIEVNSYTLSKQGDSAVDLLNAVVAMGYSFSAYPEEGGHQYDILCLPL